jgi:hypothetical protein
VLPKEIDGVEIFYMVFSLCNGDITKKKWIEENLDVGDYVEWMCFKKYDNFIKSESTKRYSELHNNK